jgi:hypothetical protein
VLLETPIDHGRLRSVFSTQQPHVVAHALLNFRVLIQHMSWTQEGLSPESRHSLDLSIIISDELVNDFPIGSTATSSTRSLLLRNKSGQNQSYLHAICSKNCEHGRFINMLGGAWSRNFSVVEDPAMLQEKLVPAAKPLL